MARTGWRGGRTLGAALLGVASLAAEPPPVSVWYRTSEGCPDGASFVTRLNGLGQSARLAGVGDRVDFVVTLGHERELSSGRLERQTRSGTVAIREYRDADCAQVAEALALTLDLALEPNVASVDSAPPGLATGTSSADPEPPPPGRMTTTQVSGVIDEPAPSTTHGREASRANVSLGAQATLATGVAPELLPGVALFVDLEHLDWIPRSTRISLIGGNSENTAPSRELDVTLLALRAEVCPLRWNASALLVLEPCAGAEAGIIRGSGGDPTGAADAGFWGSVLALGRVGLHVHGPVWLEAQVGGRMPLVRYEMGTRDGSEDWFRTPAVGLDAGVGVSWQIW